MTQQLPPNTRNHQPAGRQPSLPASTVQSIAGINEFSFRLLTQLAAANPDKNLFVSPFSIAVAFAMVCHGAAGETREEMLQTFHWTGLTMQEIAEAFGFLTNVYSINDPGLVLTMANSLWKAENDPVNPRYLEDVRQRYAADIFTISFNSPDAAETINEWVSEKTQAKIKQLVTQPDLSGVSVALLNAIYFKADWQKRFQQSETAERPFTRLDGTVELRPLMHQKNKFDYFETELFQAIALPYGEGRYRMAVILPRGTMPFAEFQQQFEEHDWQTIRSRFHEQQVQLALPRFTIMQHQLLNQPLQNLGITKAFKAAAEFPLIGAGLYITKVLHQATLTVDEEGAEAAAATAILMARSAPQSPITMTVDHPFLAIIYDAQQGTILFAGYVVDPQ